MTAETLALIGIAVTLAGAIWKLSAVVAPIKDLKDSIENLRNDMIDLGKAVVRLQTKDEVEDERRSTPGPFPGFKHRGKLR